MVTRQKKTLDEIDSEFTAQRKFNGDPNAEEAVSLINEALEMPEFMLLLERGRDESDIWPGSVGYFFDFLEESFSANRITSEMVDVIAGLVEDYVYYSPCVDEFIDEYIEENPGVRADRIPAMEYVYAVVDPILEHIEETRENEGGKDIKVFKRDAYLALRAWGFKNISTQAELNRVIPTVKTYAESDNKNIQLFCADLLEVIRAGIEEQETIRGFESKFRLVMMPDKTESSGKATGEKLEGADDETGEGAPVEDIPELLSAATECISSLPCRNKDELFVCQAFADEAVEIITESYTKEVSIEEVIKNVSDVIDVAISSKQGSGMLKDEIIQTLYSHLNESDLGQQSFEIINEIFELQVKEKLMDVAEGLSSSESKKRWDIMDEFFSSLRRVAACELSRGLEVESFSNFGYNLIIEMEEDLGLHASELQGKDLKKFAGKYLRALSTKTHKRPKGQKLH